VPQGVSLRQPQGFGEAMGRAQQGHVSPDEVNNVREPWGSKAVDNGVQQGHNQSLSVHQPLLQNGFWRSYRSGLRTLYLFVGGTALIKKF
jgi:hypothetical protein